MARLCRYQDVRGHEVRRCVHGYFLRRIRRFFDHVPTLLAGPDTRFSFFNGLGATNGSFYDVYTHLAELHLAAIGIDVEWADVDVAAQEAVRWGDTQGYFCMRIYRLPVGRIRSP